MAWSPESAIRYNSTMAITEMLDESLSASQHLLQKVTVQHSFTSLLLLVASYMLLVQALRFNNLRKIMRLAHPFSANLDKMDYKTGHAILKLMTQHEFPFSFAFGTRWALIKSYGIQGGSQLLVDTRQLSSSKNVGKRTEDTATILYEMLIAGIDSDRGSKALSKMNWLHRRYGARIENDGYIFTLGLFVLEPMRWIEDFEWRKPTMEEKVAYFSYWKEIGFRMGIKDLPATFLELKAWQDDFTARRMGFDENNKMLGDAFIQVTLRNVPKWLHGFSKQVITSFLEPRVREALGFDTPPRSLEITIRAILYCRGILVRLFFLPRFQPFGDMKQPGSDGRLHRDRFIVEPWYMRETAWIKFKKFFLGSTLSLPGPEYRSDGYLPEELGPAHYEKSSRDDVLREAAEFRRIGEEGGLVAMTCPFMLTK